MASYGSLPFREQIEFFRRKENLPTNHWLDIYGAEHDYAFVVAGASRDAIVTDFRESVEKAIADGTTLEEFRKDFDNIVARHGWDYNGGRDWRSRTIYETNLFSSYSAGRYAQLMESKDALPYWQYNHSDAVEHPRQLHLHWDGLILSADNPWWDTHFPINAWGCQCFVNGLSLDDLNAMGKTGPDATPEIEWVDRIVGQRSPDGPRVVRVPAGIDPGFEHAPGASRLTGSMPPSRPPGGMHPGDVNVTDELPPVRAGSDYLPEGLSAEDYAREFLTRFGATLETPAVYTDITGHRIVIGRELFDDAGKLVVRDGRDVRLHAEALKNPDEIWSEIEYDDATRSAVIRRRYLANVKTGNNTVPVVVEWSKTGWRATVVDDLQQFRAGVRLHRRGQLPDAVSIYDVADTVALTRGIKQAGVDEIVKGVAEVNARFGLKPLRYIGDPNKDFVRYNWSQKTLAAYAPGTDALLFKQRAADAQLLSELAAAGNANVAKHTPIDVLKSILLRIPNLSVEFREGLDALTTWKWGVSDNPIGLAYHEMGHRLHEFFEDELTAIARQGWQQYWQYLISEYGKSSIDEFIAESFCLYCSGTPADYKRIFPPMLKWFIEHDNR